MKRFKKYILEEDFNQDEYLPAAMKWLNDKFANKNLEFIHKPNLIETDGKLYHCSQNGKQFSIYGRKHDTEYSKLPQSFNPSTQFKP